LAYKNWRVKMEHYDLYVNGKLISRVVELSVSSKNETLIKKTNQYKGIVKIRYDVINKEKDKTETKTINCGIGDFEFRLSE
jgi:hypothetical protein